MAATGAVLGPELIGTEHPPLTTELERGRLRAFARAIGESDAVYLDLDAARGAGHRDLPAPPTFLFGPAFGDGPEAFAWITDLGVDMRHVLHGEQAFEYHDIAYAGDTLTLTHRISDVYTKRGGALQFLVRETDVRRDDGGLVVRLRVTLVVRTPAVAS
jgi:MaoC dehydratase-like protein